MNKVLFCKYLFYLNAVVSQALVAVLLLSGCQTHIPQNQNKTARLTKVGKEIQSELKFLIELQLLPRTDFELAIPQQTTIVVNSKSPSIKPNPSQVTNSEPPWNEPNIDIATYAFWNNDEDGDYDSISRSENLMTKFPDKPSHTENTESIPEPIFDMPLTSTYAVESWVHYFQTEGRRTFSRWLQRLPRWMPLISKEIRRNNLPQDLAYVAMIESGFSNLAVSPAQAVGMWQFMRGTANRYGLQTNWWLDERRDTIKSTRAAIRYLSDLYNLFGSWYLAAASYNLGEGNVQRLIQKHQSRDYWRLCKLEALPDETREYIPKLIAAMAIAKSPQLYGFHKLKPEIPIPTDSIRVPGGFDLINLAAYLGISERTLLDLNPALIKGFIPPEIESHWIRVPKGRRTEVAQFLKLQNSWSHNSF